MPGRDPEYGYTVIRSVKYRMEPTAASREPIAKVREIVLLMSIPMRDAVS